MRTFGILVLLLVGQIGCNQQESNGENLFEDGKYEEAIAYYTSVLNSEGFNEENLYNRGRAFEEFGDKESAKKDYNEVLSKNNRHLNSQLRLAKLAYENADYSRAILILGKALKQHDSSADGHFLLGRARHQSGFTSAAMESYNAAISLNENLGEAYLYRGALKTSLKLKSACEDLKTAERMNVDGGKEAVKKYCS